MPRIKGLDSRYWNSFMPAGYDFKWVGIKISQEKQTNLDLSAPHKQWRMVKTELGLPRLPFHYWRGMFRSGDRDPEKHGREQAEFFFEETQKLGYGLGELPPAIDCESQWESPGVNALRDICACCERTAELWGREPMIYCVSPDTRILTRGLKWIPAGDLVIGDAIIGFTENSIRERHGRFFQDAVITSAGIEPREVYRLYLSNGQILTSTGEHKWLIRRNRGRSGGLEWVRTDEIQKSIEYHSRTHPVTMPILIKPTNRIKSFETGILSAAFDGEGCLSQNGGGLSFVQKPNDFNNQVLSILDGLGYTWNSYYKEEVDTICTRLSGGRDAIFRFLQEIRPPRLLDVWETNWNISSMEVLGREYVDIEAVEFVGKEDVAIISSSSATYIAEGFGAHNTASWWWNKWITPYHNFDPAKYNPYQYMLWEADPPPDTKEPGKWTKAETKIVQEILEWHAPGFNAEIDVDFAEEEWYNKEIGIVIPPPLPPGSINIEVLVPPGVSVTVTEVQ